ncbi:hypothetical protein ACFFRR_001451 [Megaselia abdita]
MSKYVVYDCDMGLDDAWGLLLLLRSNICPKVEVLAVTCNFGNTSVDFVASNVFRMLKAMDSLHIPVYLGSSEPILPSLREDIGYYGKDGFGDIYEKIDTSALVQPIHAANAMYSIAKKHPKEVTFVCVGPLTNLAICLLLYPDFVDIVNNFAIMGGNYTVDVNSYTGNSADWNFFSDPEAAHIVLNRARSKILILPSEACNSENFTIDVDWRLNGPLKSVNTEVLDILNEAETAVLMKHNEVNWAPADAILVATFLYPSEMILKQKDYHGNVELKGDRTRGQMILDRIPSDRPENVKCIKLVNRDFFKNLVLAAANNTLS